MKKIFNNSKSSLLCKRLINWVWRKINQFPIVQRLNQNYSKLNDNTFLYAVLIGLDLSSITYSLLNSIFGVKLSIITITIFPSFIQMCYTIISSMANHKKIPMRRLFLMCVGYVLIYLTIQCMNYVHIVDVYFGAVFIIQYYIISPIIELICILLLRMILTWPIRSILIKFFDEDSKEPLRSVRLFGKMICN